MLPFPLYFSGDGIERAQRAPKRRGIVIGKIGAAVVGVAGLVWLRSGAENIALLARGDIKQAGLGIKGWRHPVGRTGSAGANAVAIGSGACFLVGGGAPLRILAGAPGHFRKRA